MFALVQGLRAKPEDGDRLGRGCAKNRLALLGAARERRVSPREQCGRRDQFEPRLGGVIIAVEPEIDALVAVDRRARGQINNDRGDGPFSKRQQHVTQVSPVFENRPAFGGGTRREDGAGFGEDLRQRIGGRGQAPGDLGQSHRAPAKAAVRTGIAQRHDLNVERDPHANAERSESRELRRSAGLYAAGRGALEDRWPSSRLAVYNRKVITLSDELRQVLTAGRLGHLTTLNADGSPQVSVVWIGVEGNDIVIGHLMGGRKVTNIARDARVALTVEAEGANAVGMVNYLIVYGRAHLIEGGAPELLQRLAEVYVGPGVQFPPMENPPAGHVIRVTPDRVGGAGPWVP